MTDSDALPRLIDIYLGEHLFGYTKTMTVPPDARGEHGGNEILLPPGGLGGYALPNLGRLARDFFIPHYTTDRRDGWENVAGAMRWRGWRVTLTNANSDARWVATFEHRDDPRRIGIASGDGVQYLVCLAAARALGFTR